MKIQKLRSRWNAFFEPYADAEYLGQTFDNLAAHYTESHRHYHTLTHIKACLQSFDQVADRASDCFSLECAIWFHDAIYDPNGSDNEELSAMYAGAFLVKTNIAPETASKVEHLIVLTKHPGYPSTDDEKYLLDIDLTILGIEPELYSQYAQWIRQEYAFIPENLYCQGRSKILQAFLDRPRIFNTDYFYHRYEAQARENLAGEIERLKN